ncbi:MAG: hypothetical protein KJ649_05125 [Proteobacteria bacterium]|nr:hypothetical protein [Pseudomonadota bacterium]MBU1744261.1 hypothetical protein [Pseudomonadota bacterium]
MFYQLICLLPPLCHKGRKQVKKLVGNGGKGLGKDDVHFRVKRPGADTLLLMGGILMTAFLLWFAVNSQISARPVARALLQGLALSLGQAIDYMAARDPSFKTLADFRYRDIAYFALIDRSGRVRFHQNPDLAGEIVADDRYLPAFSAAAPVENRIRLGTGEEAYECHLPLHLPGETLVLRLVLHTWQADQIINRARTGATILMPVPLSPSSRTVLELSAISGRMSNI